MAKKKIQLQDANGDVLHPLTLGECVTMDNGENLDTLMSKSQMFTPTITQDKSMFKVGTGVDVDYSANVKDGAYESLVFKGKSLVNLGREIDSQYHNIGGEGTQITSDGYFKIPYAGSENSHSVRLKSGLLEPLIKPDTVYSLIVEIVENTTQNARIGFTGHNNLSCVEPVDKNTNIASAVGTHVKLIKRRSEVTARQSDLYFCIWDKTNVDATKHIKFRYMILEGDWTNKELPPFFTGIRYAKMPILRNTGKNLFDKQRHSNPNNFVVNPSYWSIPIQLKGNTSYNFSYTYDNVHNKQTVLRFATDIWTNPTHSSSPYNLIEVFNTSITSDLMGKRGNARFTTPANGLVYLHYYNGELGNSLSSFNIMSWYTHLLKDVQLEEAPSATSYENYKTNILRTSEEIVLREVNGVQDTYNPLTGEYVRRIGEIVLDGSQALSLDGSLVYLGLTDRPINNFGIADKMPVITVNQLVTGEFGICMQDRGVSGRIYINIEGLTTREEILQHLRTNPITIHYGLVEPVTTIIKPSTMTPFAYQNGHVIVESGFEGQSLLPEVEYSVVTGRTGQVTQNTKVLRKQEQQITSLEELLLTQIVQMEYERTLLQFDYELQMIKLG